MQQLANLAQDKFGVELTDLNFYDGEGTLNTSLMDTVLTDVKGGTIMEGEGAGDMFIDGTDGADKKDMSNTLGHELIESVTALTGGTNAAAQEDQATAFGSHFADRVDQAFEGGINATSTGAFTTSLINSNAVSTGTNAANAASGASFDNRRLTFSESQVLQNGRERIANNPNLTEEQKQQDITRLNALACAEVRCARGVSSDDKHYDDLKALEDLGNQLNAAGQSLDGLLGEDAVAGQFSTGLGDWFDDQLTSNAEGTVRRGELGFSALGMERDSYLNSEGQAVISSFFPETHPGDASHTLNAVQGAGLNMIEPPLVITEGAATIGWNAVVTTGSGVAGLAVTPFSGTEGGAGVIDTMSGALYTPHLNGTQETLGLVGSVFEPMEAGMQWMGDTTLDGTGSPLLATGAYILPEVLSNVIAPGSSATRNGIKTGIGTLDDVPITNPGQLLEYNPGQMLEYNPGVPAGQELVLYNPDQLLDNAPGGASSGGQGLSSGFDDIALEGQARQHQLLETNQGFNITSPAHEIKYPDSTIGTSGTFVTDRAGFESVLGPLNSSGGTIRVNSNQLDTLEWGLGLDPGTLGNGSVLRQFDNITEASPSSPFGEAGGPPGNAQFRGSGMHLPSGAPEITINPQPRTDNPDITNEWIIEVDD